MFTIIRAASYPVPDCRGPKYIEPNWPKLQVIGSLRQFGVLAYNWKNSMPPVMSVFFERPWLEGNMTVTRGPLAGAYEPFNGAFRSEGDSPSRRRQIGILLVAVS
jgi:hypothetical protein